MGRLFGTDGARGVANSELTAELAMNIGRAAAMVLISDEVEHPTILIGRDTRLSGDMLEGALIAGLCSVGANVELLGVVPTPAVAYLVKKYNADAGIMISASHNPFEFNGIKIFSSEGCKLPDDLENRIEEIVLDHIVPYSLASDKNLGKVTRMDSACDDYINYIVECINCDLEGMEIAIDCSNGSSSRTAEKLFTKLGAKVHMLYDKPDGININKDCGSTHIGKLQSYVRDNKLCCGLAFDGDADRCLAVDENGNLVDGDYLIAICAKDMKDRGVLKKNAVVGTIMTNMGFNKFCEENGMKFVSTKVGDRYVLEAMLQDGYNIGGEQSGHIILLDYETTGDGQLSGATVLSIMKRTGDKLSSLAKVMERMPQVLINVKVSAEGKLAFYNDKEIKSEIKRVTDILGDRGRILVRVSGTEPLVRVMLEGENLEEIQSLAEEAAQVVRERLA
ncbi:phosphoglucosamine mutase [Ruminococcus sp. YE282]|jgi:phosphoglucosamine mutase|uniref:phosphoglucosamine mutase n=1 Tax=Ruminococcus sp. YE282 TaxID=3158780 RepID=UPI000888E4C5|nr:phosphoglucosamine mutase [Ruminococcus bromii]MDY4711674.1 phosphoglucosamine mutase [Ruminococcus bromii]MEE0963369.1 phosphoglucosamine mutase [Ruminococcus bromii]SCY69429.1 phosphoglucosamine mutase [Ruminococcus bromii]